MAKDNLLRLINQTSDIKEQFKTEYVSFVKPVGGLPVQTPRQIIHNNEKYLMWKAEIEAELDILPKSKTTEDIFDLFSKINKGINEKTIFSQLEAKLNVLGKILDESETLSEKGNVEMRKPHKLFISHSSKDADYVEAFVSLLEILGLRDDEIICSSVPPYCIPLGNKVYDWLVNEFQQCDLHVVYALSKDYYSSAASLNEMGAAWAMKQKWTGLLLPKFSFAELDGCIDKTQISIKLDDSDCRTLKYRLGELKDELIQEFSLRPMSEATWERQRDGFLDKIADVTEKRAQESKELSNHDQQYTPTVGQDDVGGIPVDPAFLLVYAAAGNGQILRLATLGAPVQVSADGKQFLADDSQRESARWQEALDMLIKWGWVKPVGRKGEVFEVTGTGYTKADWLKEGMCINTNVEPLEELKNFIG